jgi:hypothetical protein
MDGLFSNLRWTFCKSHQVARATYFSRSRTACMRASAHTIKRSIIYERILFKFAVNRLQIATSSMGCIVFMFTDRVHMCEWARVCFVRFIFQFSGNTLQIDTSSMGYILFMTRACDVITACTSVHSWIVTHMIRKRCQARKFSLLIFVNHNFARLLVCFACFGILK